MKSTLRIPASVRYPSYVLRNLLPAERPLIDRNTRVRSEGFIGHITGSFDEDDRLKYSLSRTVNTIGLVRDDAMKLLGALTCNDEDYRGLLSGYYNLRDVCEMCKENALDDSPNIYVFTVRTQNYFYLLRVEFGEINCDVALLIYDRGILRAKKYETIGAEYI